MIKKLKVKQKYKMFIGAISTITYKCYLCWFLGSWCVYYMRPTSTVWVTFPSSSLTTIPSIFQFPSVHQ